MLIQNKNFKAKTLTVSNSISETGTITLDQDGVVDLPEEKANRLLSVPGFSLVDTGDINTDVPEEQQEEATQEQPKKRGRKANSE